MKQNFKQNLKKVVYFTSIAIFGAILGLSLQFVKAWSEPASSDVNVSNVGAPITTKGSQVISEILNIKSSYSPSTLSLYGRDIRTSNDERLYLNWNNSGGNVSIGGEGERKSLDVTGLITSDYNEIITSGEPTINFHRPNIYATGIKLRSDNNLWFGGWSAGEGQAGLVARDIYIMASGKWASQALTGLYKCPQMSTCYDGQAVSGQWASYGCVGQVSQYSYCLNSWYAGGGHSCSNACVAL